MNNCDGGAASTTFSAPAKNVLAFLDATALRIPDKCAVADETGSLSFAELQAASRRVGIALLEEVSPRTPIPIYIEKSCATLALMLGAVRAGCFYCCLDPSQPSARILTILDTLQASVVVANAETAPRLVEMGFTGTILMASDLLADRVLSEADESRLLEVASRATDIDPLYVIFTSGSTGTPKGIAVGHRSVIDFITEFVPLMGITEDEVIGNQAPFDFDVSVKDIYSMLYTGATMQIIPTVRFALPTTLLDYLEERKITTLIWAVTALCLVTTLNGFKYKVPPCIRKVIFSGEVMPIKHLNKWREAYPDAMFVNVYGPTEITCNCMYYIVDREFDVTETLPLGVAFPNEQVFLLDDDNKLVGPDTPNVLGEMCVSGTCLALGYYRNPEQTQAHFVQNPLNTTTLETIYRTGDLAYYTPDGEMMFSSRKDFQIKHMGRRIELGEIEAAVDAHGEIERCCCLYNQEKKRIVLVCELSQGCDWTDKEVRAAIKMNLPEFMLPQKIIVLEKLPITAHGKIDRVLLKSQVL